MTAIVTNKFKQNILDQLINDFDSTGTNYHLAIGRSETWNATDAPPELTSGDDLQSLGVARDARNAFQSAKIVTNRSIVIPRYNWISGTVYEAWSDRLADYPTNGYYVMTDENQIYICLQQGLKGDGSPNVSTIKPTGTTTTAFQTSDGYVWKFLYTISAIDTDKFVSSNFIPVKYVDSAGPSDPATDQQQYTIQNSANPKEVIRFEITNNGAGYTSAPSVSIVGNGSGAAAKAFIDGNQVSKIIIDSDGSGNFSWGTGYDYANVVITGGGAPSVTAQARVVLGPEGGIGANPVVDLRGKAIMFNGKFNGDEGGTIVASNDIRQISLMRNLKKNNLADSDFTGTTGNFMNILNFASVTQNFTEDKTIEGQTSGAKGVVDYWDLLNQKLYYHQNDSSGYTPFDNGEQILELNGNGNGILTGTFADSAAEINRFSGELLYTDNRAAIERSVDQNEDIKVVIQF